MDGQSMPVLGFAFDRAVANHNWNAPIKRVIVNAMSDHLTINGFPVHRKWVDRNFISFVEELRDQAAARNEARVKKARAKKARESTRKGKADV